MLYKTITKTLIIIFFFALQSNFQLLKAQGNVDITIFSSDSCGWTTEMKNFLESKKIKFKFKDLAKDINQDEMSDLAGKYGYATVYLYPVMLIKDQFVMRPELEDVLKALNGKKIQGKEERAKKDENWRIGYPKSLKYRFEDIFNKIKPGQVTVYDNDSATGKKLIKELIAEKIPYKLEKVQKDDKKLRELLDKYGFGKKVVMPVVDVMSYVIMDGTINDVQLMLIQFLGD